MTGLEAQHHLIDAKKDLIQSQIAEAKAQSTLQQAQHAVDQTKQVFDTMPTGTPEQQLAKLTMQDNLLTAQ